MKKLLRDARMLLDSWYFWGVIGWILLIRAMPIDSVLPRYAG